MSLFKISIITATASSKDAEYQKSKRHLKEKFQQLKNENQRHSQIVLNNKRTIMKPAVLNLTGNTVDKNVTSLLNLGFCPDTKIYTVYGNNYSHRVKSAEIGVW